eukprot:jgi/Ulvmu1/9836/UM056_0077.1
MSAVIQIGVRRTPRGGASAAPHRLSPFVWHWGALLPRAQPPLARSAMAHYSAKSPFSDMIPKLDGRSHKGQHGKVSVVGGNFEFTGAPYYAAFSAMQVGADYGNVFCTQGAAIPIKSYAPELIVHPCMLELRDLQTGWESEDVSHEVQERASWQAADTVFSWLSKSSCVVVGPGLGKDSVMIRSTYLIMQEIQKQGLPMVIDADGIGVVCMHPELVQGYPRAVLTPNAPEFWRLCDAFNVEHNNVQPHDNPSLVQMLAKRMEGPLLLAKGAQDTVCCGQGEVLSTRSSGSPRRCGGQGDILSGTLASTISWAIAHAQSQGLEGNEEQECMKQAALNACELVRNAQEIAYRSRGRSMVASDIMHALHEAVSKCW